MNHGMTLGQIFMSWSSHPELCLAKRWKEKNMFGGHAVYAIVPVQTILSRGNNSSGILLLNHKRSWKIWSFTRSPEKCPTSQPLKAPKKVSSPLSIGDGDSPWFSSASRHTIHPFALWFRNSNITAKHLVLPGPVGPPSSYELKTW